MESNAQNQKQSRPSPKKHFMSPTISAASKANPPQKKSLAERKESIDTTPLQKTQNFDSRAAGFGENKQNPLADSLSASSPYDPFTNYLSPRPRFLRYNPNRQQEILLRRQNWIKEVNGGLSVSGSGSFSSKKVLDGEEDTSSSCGSLFMHSLEDDLIFLTLFSYLDSMSERNAKKQSTCGNAKSCSEPMTGQKCDSVPVNAEDKHIEHSVSIMNSGSSFNSVKEDTRDIYQSQAPSIELLGEFEMEDMISFLRSCSAKSRVEKCMDNKTRSVPGHQQPDCSDISTMNSAPHGTFTDERIIVKKPKGGAVREDRKVATTPVRRSSRIHKHSTVSPRSSH